MGGSPTPWSTQGQCWQPPRTLLSEKGQMTLPVSKKVELGGILQHIGRTQQDRLQARRPRWCRHCCRCFHGIRLAPSHLCVFILFYSTFEIVLDITCDVIETSGGVQLGSTDPELCNFFHQIAPSIEPARYFQYTFPHPLAVLSEKIEVSPVTARY